jgi:hypothetical protein
MEVRLLAVNPGILDRGKSMEGDIHCLLGWVGALTRPSPAIFRNYRSVNPGITTTAFCHSRRCCHVRSVVRYPQHRTLPRLTETRLLVVLLRSICKAQTLQLPLPRAGFGRAGDT